MWIPRQQEKFVQSFCEGNSLYSRICKISEWHINPQTKTVENYKGLESKESVDKGNPRLLDEKAGA
jgi:hypothetical protein